MINLFAFILSFLIIMILFVIREKAYTQRIVFVLVILLLALNFVRTSLDFYLQLNFRNENMFIVMIYFFAQTAPVVYFMVAYSKFNNKVFSNIALCISLPSSILTALLYDFTFAKIDISKITTFYLHATSFIQAITISALTLSMILPVYYLISKKIKFSSQFLNETLLVVFISCLFFPMICIDRLSNYVVTIAPFNFVYFLMVAALIGGVAFFTKILKDKSKAEKRSFLLFISFLLFNQYMSKMAISTTYGDPFSFAQILPFHMCRAFYLLIIISLLINKQWFYGIIVLLNLFGGSGTIFLDCGTQNLLSALAYSFIHLHFYVTLIPILLLTTGVYKLNFNDIWKASIINMFFLLIMVFVNFGLLQIGNKYRHTFEDYAYVNTDPLGITAISPLLEPIIKIGKLQIHYVWLIFYWLVVTIAIILIYYITKHVMQFIKNYLKKDFNPINDL